MFQILCLQNGVKKIFQLISSNSTKKKSKAPIYIDLNQHKLFELIFDDEVVTYHCEQSEIYAGSKGNFVFHVTLDELCAFLAILLILGHISLPLRSIDWQQDTNVFNYAVADWSPRTRFEKMLRSSHPAENVNFMTGDNLAKVPLFFNLMT